MIMYIMAWELLGNIGKCWKAVGGLDYRILWKPFIKYLRPGPGHPWPEAWDLGPRALDLKSEAWILGSGFSKTAWNPGMSFFLYKCGPYGPKTNCSWSTPLQGLFCRFIKVPVYKCGFQKLY